MKTRTKNTFISICFINKRIKKKPDQMMENSSEQEMDPWSLRLVFMQARLLSLSVKLQARLWRSLSVKLVSVNLENSSVKKLSQTVSRRWINLVVGAINLRINFPVLTRSQLSPISHDIWGGKMPLHIYGSSLLLNTFSYAFTGVVGFHRLQDPFWVSTIDPYYHMCPHMSDSHFQLGYCSNIICNNLALTV